MRSEDETVGQSCPIELHEVLTRGHIKEVLTILIGPRRYRRAVSTEHRLTPRIEQVHNHTRNRSLRLTLKTIVVRIDPDLVTNANHEFEHGNVVVVLVARSWVGRVAGLGLVNDGVGVVGVGSRVDVDGR